MPTYDYRCSKCGHLTTEFLKMSDRKIPTEKPCIMCWESGTVSQLIGAPKIVSAVQGQYRHSEDFNSQLKRISKKYGKDSKIDNIY